MNLWQDFPTIHARIFRRIWSALQAPEYPSWCCNYILMWRDPKAVMIKEICVPAYLERWWRDTQYRHGTTSALRSHQIYCNDFGPPPPRFSPIFCGKSQWPCQERGDIHRRIFHHIYHNEVNHNPLWGISIWITIFNDLTTLPPSLLVTRDTTHVRALTGHHGAWSYHQSTLFPWVLGNSYLVWGGRRGRASIASFTSS